jgi:four helix bundle protein
MSNYKKLLVWQETLVLIDEVYDVAMGLPDYETFALSNQLRRAVVSIASNIAEGAGRGTLKDYIHFLYNAKGSAYEVETQLIICARRRFITAETANHIIFYVKKVIWLLKKLIASLEDKMAGKAATAREDCENYGEADDGDGFMPLSTQP